MAGQGGEGRGDEAMATAFVILTPLCSDESGCLSSDCPQPVPYRYPNLVPCLLHLRPAG